MVLFEPAAKFFTLPIGQPDALRDGGDAVPDVLRELNTLVHVKLQDFTPVSSSHSEPTIPPRLSARNRKPAVDTD